MALDPLTAGEDLANTVAGIVSKFIPDPEKQVEARIQLMGLMTQVATAQSATNTAEAQNPNMFVAGWRPFIGWVCGFVIATIYIPKTLALLGIWVYVCIKTGQFAPPPSIDTTDVFTLLGGILGLGGMRTFEKYAGIDDKVIGKGK